ncbi:MAG: phosphatase PAP2 family protein [Acidobacteriota bacterium]|nr:phosphatase PAP2 family protein [Acidobacteriota bacterium]
MPSGAPRRHLAPAHPALAAALSPLFPLPGPHRRPGQARPASLDERLLIAARTIGHSARNDRLVARFSRLGEHAALWLALAAAGSIADPPRRRAWRRAGATVAGTYVLNSAIKLTVRRRRPELAGFPPLTSTPTRLSFPSAHAATSAASARLYRRLGVAPAVVYPLACALSYSRLYLGVHYPSDVLAGALMGWLVAGAAGPTGTRP